MQSPDKLELLKSALGLLVRENFSNDKVDAGEIGAGHSVTAIYEIALSGSAGRYTRLKSSRTLDRRPGTIVLLPPWPDSGRF
jgi:hypothetical protein